MLTKNKRPPQVERSRLSISCSLALKIHSALNSTNGGGEKVKVGQVWNSFPHCCFSLKYFILSFHITQLCGSTMQYLYSVLRNISQKSFSCVSASARWRILSDWLTAPFWLRLQHQHFIWPIKTEYYISASWKKYTYFLWKRNGT